MPLPDYRCSGSAVLAAYEEVVASAIREDRADSRVDLLAGVLGLFPDADGIESCWISAGVEDVLPERLVAVVECFTL